MNVCESPSKLKTTDAESLSTFVKLRRSRDWQNEVYTSKQRIISKYSYGDRFIPQRFNSMKLDTNINYVGKTAEQDILHNDFKLNSSYWRQAKFVTNINEIFNIQHSRLLHFGSQTQPEYSLQSRRSCSALKTEDWACLARLRPSAWPDVTNAMPQTSVSYNPNRMDWSTSKQIALSFKENIIVWREGQDITMVFKVNSARALKYSPCGRYLAISCMDMSIPVVELWEVLDEDEFLVSNGKFFKKIYKFISSIEWTHDSKQIVCGTGSGHIIVYSIHDMSTQKILSQHKHKIKRIKLSSAGRYLATSDYKGLIYVFDTNSYNVVAQLDCNVGGLFDWHPWSEPELAIDRQRLYKSTM
ncbi:protein cortex isoform X2 [Drosophila busckii]|uniref:protein cortex isoform X2 n=1 Tax=Drosophila busckii TaxID=30019 RepID=UPI00083ED825|nr:protein cortex isoform X2 [Drosophila busckii]